MSETPIEVAANLLAEERQDMVASAGILVRRLNSLIEHGGEHRNYDFPTIVSMLGRMRDSIEAYRCARAVHTALAAATGPAGRGDGDAERRAEWHRIYEAPRVVS